MTKILSRLLEKMTPQERAEVETFAVFVLARRKLRKTHILTDNISTQELMRLVEDSGSFDWLYAEEENIYSVNDGEAVQWPDKSDES